MELHLVADTNLFFECKALDQLPWSELGADTVVILLTKPVLDEIDKHKKGNGRTRERAVAIYARIRDMLRASEKEVELQSTFPRVVLRREAAAKPDPSLGDILNYPKTDETLIGITSALSGATPGADVKLFTDDTGPAATADSLGVPFLLIDESWRRPPAETTEQRKIKDLEKDLATYRAQEPSIAIVCEGIDASGFVAVTNRKATPLSEGEITALVERLRLKHPLKTDFTPPGPKTERASNGGTTNTEYAAPSDDAMAKYRDRDYPGWIGRCTGVLRNLHIGRGQIQRSVVLRWRMSNEGTRPGSRVRVEFEAKGPLDLKRIREPNAEDDTSTKVAVPAEPPVIALPVPPKPPAFQITTTRVLPPAPRSAPHGFDSMRRAVLPTAFSHSAELAELASSAGMVRPSELLVSAELAKWAKVIRPDGLPGSAELAKWANVVRPSGLPGSAELARWASGAIPFETSIGRAFTQPVGIESWARIPDYASLVRQGNREPEEFYYDWPRDVLVKKGALTCELWRHGSEAEIFEFEVVFLGDGSARGAVECTVHAENLTQPVRQTVKVARIVEPESMADLANALIEARV